MKAHDAQILINQVNKLFEINQKQSTIIAEDNIENSESHETSFIEFL